MNEKMKVYIAGKISGDHDYYAKFKAAQEDLEDQGFTVINPAELPEGMCQADYMRICFAMIESADVVAFLPDYEESKGAQLEWAWCQYVGKQTMYLSQMNFYRPNCADFVDKDGACTDWEGREETTNGNL